MQLDANTTTGEPEGNITCTELEDSKLGLTLGLQLPMRERERIDQRAAETMRGLYDALNERPSMKAVGD